MTGTILALSIAYAVLGVLLLILALRSPYKWWIKGAAIVITSSFFIIAFYKTRSLQGWPIAERMPPKFQLLWVRVVEPSRAYNEPGAIFMWVETLDENNAPSGVPRAYKLRYAAPLAERAEKAKEQLMQGDKLEGTAQDMIEDDGRASSQTTSGATGQGEQQGERGDAQNGDLDPEFLSMQPQQLMFAPLKGPLLPVKGPQ